MSERAAGKGIPRVDRGFARLGDAFVNLAFSYAKTRVKGKPFGERVPDRVLSRALELTKFSSPKRLNHGERGDVVEATIAYSWLGGLLSLEEAVEVLTAELSASYSAYESRAREREAAARAFSRLFLLSVERIEKAREREGGRR